MADGNSGAVLATERLIAPVPPRVIEPDPGNPRRSFPEEVFDVSDLVGSVRAHGIIEPLWVRTVAECRDCGGAGVGPDGDLEGCPICGGLGHRFRLILGERLWLAGKAVGLRALPCEVHDELTEEEIREVQHVENVNRVGLSPLQEAASLGKLLEGRDAGAVADRVGKPVRHVRERLALLELVPAARELLAAGRWSLGFALQVATLVPAGQEEVIGKLHDDEGDGEPIGRRRFALIRSARRRLAGCGFPLGDASLPGGACTACPKRAGAQIALWAEALDNEDACGDPTCFDAKLAEQAERVRKRVEAAGGRVLPVEEARKLYPWGGRLCDEGRRRVVDLDDDCDEVAQPPHDEPTEVHAGEVPRWKPPTWREALGPLLAAQATAASISVAVDPDKRAHEVLDRPAALRAVQLAGLYTLRPAPDTAPRFDETADRGNVIRDHSEPAKAKKPKAPPKSSADIDRDAEDAGRDMALTAIAARVSSKKPDVSLWRLLAGLAMRHVDAVDERLVGALLVRHGLAEEGAKLFGVHDTSRKAMAAQIASADERGLAAFTVELLASADETGDEDDCFAVACRWAGVDLPALVEEERAKLKPAEKPAKKSTTHRDVNPAKSADEPPAGCDAVLVACPFCRVAAGALCKTQTGPRPAPHSERVRLAAMTPKKREKWLGKRAAIGQGVDDARPEPTADDPLVDGGACRVCGCTDDDACVPTCAWADMEQTLCTACAGMAEQVEGFLVGAKKSQKELLDLIFEESMVEPESNDEERLDQTLLDLQKAGRIRYAGKSTRFELAPEAAPGAPPDTLEAKLERHLLTLLR